ncbi:NF038143 family protein [Desulfosarcina sp.]|uniref:NF038143 family protein n=1 Tax=Desulfosarcina sp. TaxID=2027861 RepID=UPI00356AE61E
MTDTPTLSHKRDLILDDEKRFAAQVSAKVIDKPRLDVWMILIPVFFIFYFWQLKRYAKGRKTFAEKFLITRQRALDEALQSAENGQHPDIERLVQASDVPAETRHGYRPWVTLLVEHYRDLILAQGSSYPALVKSTYKTRTNYLLFLNRLNQVERDFDAALKPHLEKTTENVNGIIKLMEESVTSLRRQLAESIFP